MKAKNFKRINEILAKMANGKISVKEQNGLYNLCGFGFEAGSHFYNKGIGVYCGIDINTEDPNKFLDDWVKLDVNKEWIFAKKEAIMATKKVKDFLKEASDFSSGYSMGEEVVLFISFADYNVTYHEIVRDNKKTYSRSCKWNNKITYGTRTMTVTVKNGRASYEVTEKVK